MKVPVLYLLGKNASTVAWHFPPKVRRAILQECAGQSILHLFGGQADFGLRLDIDPVTRPDVIGDAWLPPFAAESFDVVILDPPYSGINAQEKNALFLAAVYIARRRVVWFHTHSCGWAPGLSLEKFYFVRVGNLCATRILEFYKVRRPKQPSLPWFTRGPAIKYNRWLRQPGGLAFGEATQ